MLKIEVTGSYIKHVTGSKGANAGKQFDIPMVRAFAWLPGERYPTKCDYSVAKGQQAPAEGFYMLAPESLYVDEYGRISVKQSLTLVPLPAETAAPLQAKTRTA